MDPCTQVCLVEKVFPWIDEVVMLLGCVSFSCEAIKWALLILMWLDISTLDHTC